MKGHHRHASQMLFPERADVGPFIAVFGSSIPLSPHHLKKKRYQIWTPSDKPFWIRTGLGPKYPFRLPVYNGFICFLFR